MSIPVIAIFDVGKTNKKIFFFDENYRIVFEKTAQFTESEDEDGFRYENLASLKLSIDNTILEIYSLKKYKVKAFNFSTYGASLVYLDRNGNPLTPLYSYLKPFPKVLNEKFYDEYGGEQAFSLQTASPVLGSLNSGLQLYRLKYEQREKIQNLFFALHLPQYMSFLLTGRYFSDLTSIGCHTALWDFKKQDYHSWVDRENLRQYLAPIEIPTSVYQMNGSSHKYKIGIGLHDSSAALIPYLLNFSMPFILISTGTWSISMNPFNHLPLTAEELENNCLTYLQYDGSSVKASRLHAGLEHETAVQKIADYFQQDVLKYRDMPFDPAIVQSFKFKRSKSPLAQSIKFDQRNLDEFRSDREAYHQLIMDLIDLQYESTSRIIGDSGVKRIFVDGGFSRNSIFMNLLAAAFPEMEVFAASMAQATAVGAALAIHHAWSAKPVPNDIIELKFYSSEQTVQL